MLKKYQTIASFMREPFHQTASMEKNRDYEKLYTEFSRNHKIYVAGYTEIEDSYYIHIRVPSESQKGQYEYDVVIRFFTDDPSVQAQTSLAPYYIQFFSNSPGFIYRYAVLYKEKGYLIEALYNKMDPEYKDKLPEKTNPDMKLSYDKSIYFACKFISEHQFRILNKRGLLLQKKKSPEKFFLEISSFKSVKLDQDLLKAERSLKKELEKQRDNKSKSEKRRLADKHRKVAGKTTSKLVPSSVVRAVKKVGKTKIKAVKSTRRKR